MIVTSDTPVTVLRFLAEGLRVYPLRSLRITADIPAGRHPLVSGVVTGRFLRMGSLVSIRHDLPGLPDGQMIEDIRPEWITEMEII